MQTTGEAARLLVDSNGNGDLTDDPVTEWKPEQAETIEKGKTVTIVGTDGKACQTYQGSSKINLGTPSAPYEVHLRMYQFDARDPYRAGKHQQLFYYGDYGVEGELTFGRKTYRAALFDFDASGDFGAARDKQNPDGGIRLFVDRNENGRLDGSGELYEVDRPFNIGGTTYKVHDIAKNGLSLQITVSDKQVKERPPVVDARVGKTLSSFHATTIDGTRINFPAEYRGKIVLVDFWATWCGPCLAELPSVAITYKEFSSKGFDVLSIALDGPESADQVKKIMAENGAEWRQVLDGDGKGEHEAISKLYGVEGLPAPFLIDCDSGQIIAIGGVLRGAQLRGTIEAAIAKRASARKQAH